MSSDQRPSWVRTVVERRLLWLVRRHPHMKAVKRDDWAAKEFQPGPKTRRRDP